MAIVLEQNIRSTILVSGGYNNPNLGTHLDVNGHVVYDADPNAPTLYDAHGAVMVAGGVGGIGAHYRLRAGTAFKGVLGHHAQSGGKLVSFRPDERGSKKRCSYLPYCDNYITSVIVPRTIKTFFTDNLSGCAVYVARAASGDLVCFHANARRVQGVSGDVAATTLMRQMRDAAIQDYRGWLAQNVTLQGSIEKATYFTGAITHYTNRKQGQGRTNVSTLGEGCNVIGIQERNRWKFYFQTWALVRYDRHGASAFFKGGQRQAQMGSGKILQVEPFWEE